MAYVRIPSFQSGQQVVDSQGRFTPAALRSLNDAFSQLANAINIIAQIPEIQAALVDLDRATQDARQAAQDAQDAADNAAMAGGQTARATALANSYPTGAELNAVDDGGSASITISAHSRIYATNPLTTVTVGGGDVTGLGYGKRYYIYYDQPSREGGVVTYMATLNPTDVAQVNDRHSVGYADTPALGQPNKPGFTVVPPGGSYERVLE